MKISRFFVLPALLVLAVGGESQAIPSVWGVWDWQITDPVHILVTPSGHGTMLTDAGFMGGSTIDATISVQLWIDAGDTGHPNPQFVPNFPAEDIWLEFPGLNPCIGLTHADGPTDSEGWFTFSGSPGMGGWIDPVGGPPFVYVMVSGSILYDEFGQLISPTIVANSPDINADLSVNLTDVVIFAEDFHGAYSYRSDLFWDGVINLTDVAILAPWMGDTCP